MISSTQLPGGHVPGVPGATEREGRRVVTDSPRIESLKVLDLDACTDPRWAGVSTGRRCELFTDQRWLATIRDVYGFDLRARVVLETSASGAEHLIAALPYAVIDDPRGRRVVSLPFADFVDVPVDDACWTMLAGPILDLDAPVVLDTPEGHPAVHDPRFESAITGVHLVLDGATDPDEAMAGYATLPRRQIRRAARDGIEFSLTTSRSVLEDFHRLHVEVRKYRHGLLAQPFDLFAALHERFFETGAGVIVQGTVDGQLVGGCLLLKTDDAWHYKFAVSDPDWRRSGVSHGAVDAARRFVHGEGGGVALDFGRSDLADAGLVEFKRRFRPDEQALWCHRSGEQAPSQFGRDLHRITELFVDPSVPDHVTAAAGATLYRYFA